MKISLGYEFFRLRFEPWMRNQMKHHNLIHKAFSAVSQYLFIQITQGTLVGTTIIQTPTQNRDKSGGDNMYLTKRNNHWFFSMKAHSWVTTKSDLTYSLVEFVANKKVLNKIRKLLHGYETFISAYAGYLHTLMHYNVSRDGFLIDKHSCKFYLLRMSTHPLRFPVSQHSG